MLEEFCPRCGTARLAAFRFCRGCRFDFDHAGLGPAAAYSAPSLTAVVAPAPAPRQTARRSVGQSFLAIGVLMLVGFASLGGFLRIDVGSATSANSPSATAPGAIADAGATPTAPKRVGAGSTTPGTAVEPRAEPTAKDAAKPAKKPHPTPPAPKPHNGVFGNPWGYDFRSGDRISDPPSTFCDYFDCATGFWEGTDGFVVQCRDGAFSRGGGRTDACGDNHGVRRTLYRH
jgi:hypothetical protein